MADAGNTIGSVLGQSLINDFGLDKSFSIGLKGFCEEFSWNYFRDAGSIVGTGVPALMSFFALLGVSGLEAVQTIVALLYAARSPDNQWGYVYANRARFLLDLADACNMAYDPANKSSRNFIGVDISTVRQTPVVDRFAYFVSLFWQRQKSVPSIASLGAFSHYLALRLLVDNFVVFDLYRVSLQETIPCNTAPTAVSFLTMGGSPTLDNFSMRAFGRRGDAV